MIALEAVTKTFPGAAEPAVRGVDLSVAKGEFLAVLGASGSGKTTLVKMINRLVEPDSGTIRIGGEAADAGPAWALRRRIGYVFQGVGLFPHLTVAENIAITLRLLSRPLAERQARAKELLELVGLPLDFGARAPAALSGGQRQRVGLARALAAEPEVLLLDEPFGALDAVTRDTLGREVRRLHERLGLTTVMITHDALEAVLLADRIAVMRDGRVIADDAPAKLLADHPDPDVRALFDTPRRQAEAVAAMVEQSA